VQHFTVQETGGIEFHQQLGLLIQPTSDIPLVQSHDLGYQHKSRTTFSLHKGSLPSLAPRENSLRMGTFVAEVAVDMVDKMCAVK
jgi:hypothetical protein